MRIVDSLIRGLLLFFTIKSNGDAFGDQSYGPSLAAQTAPNYCPYFQNRGPSKQDDLNNCTWYKDNACCLNSELEIAFNSLNAIRGASKKCVSYLNYLYCYICAPDQNTFFQHSTVFVCEEFCNKVYYYCKDALLKGMEIKEMYVSGKEFCEGRRFKTAKQSRGGCFHFDPNSMTTNSKSTVRAVNIVSLLLTVLSIHIIVVLNSG